MAIQLGQIASDPESDGPAVRRLQSGSEHRVRRGPMEPVATEGYRRPNIRVVVPSGAHILRPLGAFFWKYGAILLFLLAWQLLAQFEVIDSSIIPPFTKVVVAMIRGFSDGGLLSNMLVSLQRSGTAFGIAVAVAIPLGLFMGTFRRFESFVDALVQMFRQTSALAIYPVFILLLGLGETSKITIICWAAFFPILLNTISGVKLVDARLIEMARVFGASKREIFKRVVLPAAAPSIFVGLRLSATTSLLLLVAAEMIGAKKGLGFLVINAQYNFEIPLMFAAIVLLAMIGLAVNYILLILQSWCCGWDSRGQAKTRASAANA
jgi:sulfonate transport system permease protein